MVFCGWENCQNVALLKVKKALINSRLFQLGVVNFVGFQSETGEDSKAVPP
jgi:hypothetical protein